MNYRRHIWLPVLAVIVVGFGLVVNLPPPQGIAAPPSPPAALPNVNVMNTPGVHVLNTPTVRVQERNWQYQAVVIPKAFPGTPEWNQFVERLNSFGQQGWELVNIVESVALMKKST